MKNYLKKLGAVVMAATMIFGAGAGVAAEDTDPGKEPSSGDTATLTVENVDPTATVVGYQIVEAKYDDDGEGILKYVAAKSVEGIIGKDDPIKLTEDVITEIAKEIQADENKLGLTEVKFNNTEGGSTFTVNAEAGSYIVLVTVGADVDTIYNPLVVSAGYDDNSELADGTVDATDTLKLNSEIGYAKSSSLGLEKTITDSTKKDDEGDDLYIGDTANFKIETKIPDYSDAYKNVTKDVTFKLTDTLDKGFTVTEETPVTVKVDSVEISHDGSTYSIDILDNVITIEFKENYIFENGGKDVEVTYQAVLNEKAERGVDANENNVVLTYTKDLDGNTKEIRDTTYHYTFDIKEELKKVDEDEKALSEATFTLTDVNGKTYEMTTKDDGFIKFEGLDEGTYKLVETEAPAGYTVNKTEYSVVIETIFHKKSGKLKQYSIKVIEGENVSTSTYTVEGGTPSTTEIKNTRIQELPSTGGTGTYLFTLIGVGLMTVATGMYFFNKKRTMTK